MLQSNIFVVNDEPYCIWEVDLRGRNREFLDGIDMDYFDYILNVHSQAEDDKRSAIALRSALHHALETMFSLLGAYIQSPYCVYAWIAKCQNKSLRSLVEKVTLGEVVFTKLPTSPVSWENVAQYLFRNYKPKTDENKKASELFGRLWERLAHEYISENNVNEYNSIKHGFRIIPGGFSMSIGLQEAHGTPAPDSNMMSFGESKYGSSIFNVSSIGGKGSRSCVSSLVAINWSIEQVIGMLNLTSISIKNIVSALKILNGYAPKECLFFCPDTDDFFDEPWKYFAAISNMTMEFQINEDDFPILTKSQLQEVIKKYMDDKPKTI